MKKITKLCGIKKNTIILDDVKIDPSKNLIFFCTKCKKESKDLIFLCNPKIKKES